MCLAVTRDGRHRPRSVVFYDIVAAFVHASIDEVVGVVPQEGLLERGVCFLLLKALYGTRTASKWWQRHHTRVLRTLGWSASKVMPGFMTEGSDALLDRKDRVTKDEFDAKMLGRVRRGQLTEVKFLERTLRWHEQEVCFSWSGGTRYVTDLAVLLGLTDTRAVKKTLGPKATGGGACDVLEPLDTFQETTFRSAVGLIGHNVLDRPDCQYAAETVRSATRETSKLEWVRVLVAHSELRNTWNTETQIGQARTREGAQPERSNSLDSIPSNSAAQLITSSLSQAKRQSCMQQDVQQ